jgi:hypothetical protein
MRNHTLRLSNQSLFTDHPTSYPQLRYHNGTLLRLLLRLGLLVP